MREPHLTSHILQEHSSPPSSPAFHSRFKYPTATGGSFSPNISHGSESQQAGSPSRCQQKYQHLHLYPPPLPPSISTYMQLSYGSQSTKTALIFAYSALKYFARQRDRVCTRYLLLNVTLEQIFYNIEDRVLIPQFPQPLTAFNTKIQKFAFN